MGMDNSPPPPYTSVDPAINQVHPTAPNVPPSNAHHNFPPDVAASSNNMKVNL